jgi:lysosomal Pro-X carboxypeptidase
MAHRRQGNYPYPSTYLMHGKSFLPSWPVRKACKALSAPSLQGRELFGAVLAALAVQLNNTGAATCFFNRCVLAS